jgi:N-acetylglucosamine kinase-like BadF-type ATPase
MLEYYLGIDAGGTKSEAVLCDENYRIASRNWYQGLNLRGLNPNIAASTVKLILEDMTYRAGLLPYHIGLTVLAAAGAGDAKTREMVEWACKNYMPTQKVKVVTDAEAALTGAFNGTPGIVIIAGTGSIAWGKDDNGKIARAGGLGYLLGDEGSGFWLGQQALKKALNYHYNGKGSILGKKICELWGLRDLEEALNLIYQTEKPAPKIAEIAPLIFQILEAGDDLAKEILCEAGSELAELVLSLAESLEFRETIKFCLCGGLAKSGILEKEVNAHLDMQRFVLTMPLYETAIGAVMVGRMICEKS